MSFERSSRRRPRLWTTLAALGLAGSLLASGSPAAHAYADPKDPTPTENYVPVSGYTPGPRAGGPLTLQTGALLGIHTDDVNVVSTTDPVTHKTVKRAPTMQDEPIYTFEQKLGRTLDIDNHYTSNFGDFYNANTGAVIPMAPAVQLDAQANRIPILGWNCAANTDVTSGKVDKEIDAAAQAFKDFGRQFFMRYCWEMDGSRQPASVNGNPDQFIAAWRYIYNRVKNIDGATNVVWLWTANANGFKLGNPSVASQFYPGDDYVDWVSADGYNWHGAVGRPANADRYRDLLEIYDQFMAWARSDDPSHQHVGSAKPIMVAEYGTQEQEDGGALKADWFRTAHATVMPRTADTPADCKYCGAMSDIQAMVYFDIKGKSGDASGGWDIETSQPSFDAYKEAAQNPWFNHIGDLTWGPYTGQGPTGPGPQPDPICNGPGPCGPGTTPTTTPTPVVRSSDGSGYWMLGSDGKVYAFGQSKYLGAPALPAGVTAADLESTPTGNGYWIVDSAGNVYSYGDAAALGGIGAGRLAAGETVTSLSSTPSGQGYWIFTTKGRVAALGDAVFYGDMSKTALAGPILDSIPTPSGKGYYMVGSDGGIFAFGDAKFYGSMGGKKLNAPVQSLVPDGDGAGYWLVASDGGIFAFDAPFRGSMGGEKLAKPVTGMVPYGDGYLMVGEDGGIFNFSSSQFLGSLGANPPVHPVVSVAALR